MDKENVIRLESYLKSNSLKNVKNIIREIYDKTCELLNVIPLKNECRDKVPMFARKLRVAEAICSSIDVGKFILEGYGAPPEEWKIIIKGACELRTKDKDPQTIVSALANTGKLVTEPIYHPLVKNLMEDGISDLNLSDKKELEIAKKLISKGIVKVVLILDNMPLDELHFKMRELDIEKDSEKASQIIAEMEELINDLPEPVKNFIEKPFEELKRCLKENSLVEEHTVNDHDNSWVILKSESKTSYLGRCPICGHKLRYDVFASTPRTFSGETRPRKVCPKCGYTTQE